MNRREFLITTTAAGVAFSVLGMGRLLPKQKPNFLFILVDDLGWSDLSCYGSKFYDTPNIDGLAKESMKFTDAYAACPVCSPSRASILTGKYPARLGLTDYIPFSPNAQNWRNKPLIPAPFKEELPLSEVTIAESLKQDGYSTFIAGKWHLGKDPKFWPEHQGFDINKGGWAAGRPTGKGKYFTPYGNPRLEDGPAGEYLPERLSDETVKFIKQHKESPFFAYLSFYSVHIPLMTRKDLEQKYEKKKEDMGLKDKWGQEGDNKVRLVQDVPVYAGMVSAVDTACGKVLDTLQQLGLEDNTIIFFMSDNGGLSTAQGYPTSNMPLRGGKGWLYEGGIREPLLVRWPGVTKPGSVCSEPVTGTDFYPTILEMAGLQVKADNHIDGKSWVPLLKGKKMQRGPIYWHYPHYGDQGSSPASAVRDGDWKLILWYEGNRRELFNLKDDIGEQNNLVDKEPEIAEKLYNELQVWLKKMDAKIPVPNPNVK